MKIGLGLAMLEDAKSLYELAAVILERAKRNDYDRNEELLSAHVKFCRKYLEEIENRIKAE